LGARFNPLGVKMAPSWEGTSWPPGLKTISLPLRSSRLLLERVHPWLWTKWVWTKS
jgi:hypothetical protein